MNSSYKNLLFNKSSNQGIPLYHFKSVGNYSSVFYNYNKEKSIDNSNTGYNTNKEKTFKKVIIKSFVSKIKQKEKLRYKFLPKLLQTNRQNIKHANIINKKNEIPTIYLKLNLANLSYLRAKSTGRSVNYNDLNKKSKRESEIEKKILFQCIKNDLLRESITNSSKNFTK